MQNVVENEDSRTDAELSPPSIVVDERWGRWAELDGNAFKIRGKNYMADRVKVIAGPTIFQLGHCEMYAVDQRVDHVCSRPGSFVNTNKLVGPNGEKPFFFVINIQVPGYTFVVSLYHFGHKTKDEKFNNLLQEYINGDDEYRNNRFKMIPTIVEGNWVVKKAVGAQPTLLGNKITQRYYSGENYVETDCDVASSKIATSIFSVARGATKGLVVDMAWVLQGNAQEELPERIVGCIRMCNVAFDSCLPIPY